MHLPSILLCNLNLIIEGGQPTTAIYNLFFSIYLRNFVLVNRIHFSSSQEKGVDLFWLYVGWGEQKQPLKTECTLVQRSKQDTE